MTAAAWILAVLASALQPATPSAAELVLEQNIVDVVSTVRGPIDIEGISLRACGYSNAWYHADTRTLEFCTELAAESPEFQRFVVAHEMSHAIIDQLEVPFTGSEEDAADELGALLLISTGHAEDLVGAASHYWEETDSTPDPTDDHATSQRRGWNLLCLYAGSIGDRAGSVMCTYKFSRAAHAWARLLSNDRKAR